jgi:hypothetical protein
MSEVPLYGLRLEVWGLGLRGGWFCLCPGIGYDRVL